MDEQGAAQLASADEFPGLMHQGIEAEVVVHGGHPARLPGQGHQLGRFRAGHGQGLLAEDVLAGGQGGLGVGSVEMVGHGEVDHLDCGIGQGRREGGIALGQAQLQCLGSGGLRIALHQAGHWDAETAQPLEVGGSDEARADDACGGPGVHGRISWNGGGHHADLGRMSLPTFFWEKISSRTRMAEPMTPAVSPRVDRLMTRSAVARGVERR